MTLTPDTGALSHLEEELEQLKDELAERLVRNAASSDVSEIEARIQGTWAAIEACTGND